MLRRLRRAGLQTSTFAYTVTFEDFSAIRERLAAPRIEALAAAQAAYVLVGHSLGGVLLRAAMNTLPADVRLPQQVYLLGSPVQPARMAHRLMDNVFYRAIAGDCGQLLGSEVRMAGVGSIPVPTMSIAGVRGLPFSGGAFGEDENDGVVSLSEVQAPWISVHVSIPVVHTLLPSSQHVSDTILQSLDSDFTPM